MTGHHENLTTESLIALDCGLTDKESTLEFLAWLFTNAGRAVDADALLHDLQKREGQVSTAMGFGFAIPHAKSAAAKAASVAYVRLRKGIPWSETEEVGHVLSIIVPEGGSTEHLQILARLARGLVDEGYRERLTSAETVGAVVARLDI